MYEQIAVQKTLHEKFLEIKMKNPHYSLRAFSNKLGLSSSSVSEILNGKRRISIKMAKRIIQKLELSPRERSNLLELFPKKSKEDVEEIKKTKNIIQLTMDQLQKGSILVFRKRSKPLKDLKD
ncbi:MAG: helix-turn-helix domain-containing protein [Deltaproteobacteria bacterium]|nr:helix-turn-helix domain-containing protein [Deltaproteobacteria bacterium]